MGHPVHTEFLRLQNELRYTERIVNANEHMEFNFQMQKSMYKCFGFKVVLSSKRNVSKCSHLVF